MSQTMSLSPPSMLRTFTKDTLVKGQPAQVECVEMGGQTYSVTRGPVTGVSLEDEWYEDVRDPEAVIAGRREEREFKPDIFRLWQRLPDLEPRYSYHREWDDIAVLPANYDQWWNHLIKSRVRSLVRKSEKEGVVVRETSY